MNTDEARAQLQQRQAERLAVLHAAFQLSNGTHGALLLIAQVAEFMGTPVMDVFEAAKYLQGEGFLEIMTIDGLFRLTHAGHVEVESTIMNPGAGTRHFPPAVIQIFNNTTNNTTHNSSTVHGNVAANVTGSGNTTTATQIINTVVHQEARAQLAELRRLAAGLKQPDHAADADEILVFWEDAVETNDKKAAKRLPGDSRRLQGIFTAENIAAAATVIPPVVEALTKLLGS